MANYCFTNYRLQGEKETLLRIAEAINAKNAEGECGWIGDIFQRLGIDVDTDKDLPTWWYDGAVTESGDGAVLSFREEAKWWQSGYMDRLIEHFNDHLADKAFFLSEVFEEELHKTNDSEGVFFPYRYVVFTGDDEKYVRTEDEAKALLKEDEDTYEPIELISDEEIRILRKLHIGLETGEIQMDFKKLPGGIMAVSFKDLWQRYSLCLSLPKNRLLTF